MGRRGRGVKVGEEGDYISIATATRMNRLIVNMLLNVHRNHQAY